MRAGTRTRAAAVAGGLRCVTPHAECGHQFIEIFTSTRLTLRDIRRSRFQVLKYLVTFFTLVAVYRHLCLLLGFQQFVDDPIKCFRGI